MPLYEYQGKTYDLPEGLTTEQAKDKIVSFCRLSLALKKKRNLNQRLLFRNLNRRMRAPSGN